MTNQKCCSLALISHHTTHRRDDWDKTRVLEMFKREKNNLQLEIEYHMNKWEIFTPFCTALLRWENQSTKSPLVVQSTNIVFMKESKKETSVYILLLCIIGECGWTHLEGTILTTLQINEPTWNKSQILMIFWGRGELLALKDPLDNASLTHTHKRNSVR